MQAVHTQSHLVMLLPSKTTSVATASAASGIYIERCPGSILAGDG
jgi:hypothetical protein